MESFPLRPLDVQDEALLSAARAAIGRGYDAAAFRHTVGAAVLCQSGKVYVGVNVYTLHGACAEQVAIGAAAAVGETEFLRIVAVRGARGEEILPPCGNCRHASPPAATATRPRPRRSSRKRPRKGAAKSRRTPSI